MASLGGFGEGTDGLSAPSGANDALMAANIAPQRVGGGAGVTAAHSGGIFFFDPTPGTLVMSPGEWNVARKALRRETRRFALDLYIRQTGPQFAYFRFQFSLLRFKCRRLLVLTFCYISGIVSKGLLKLLSGKVADGSNFSDVVWPVPTKKSAAKGSAPDPVFIGIRAEKDTDLPVDRGPHGDSESPDEFQCPPPSAGAERLDRYIGPGLRGN